MKLDAAVAELLAIDKEHTSITSAGGGGCSSASTFIISAQVADGSSKKFFMKTAPGNEARIMFEGEDASLTAIHQIVPQLCPRSYGWGKFSESNIHFLVTDFLDMSPRSSPSSQSNAQSLAAKLAKLHTTTAPIPKGQSKPVFGFPVTTCCGDTPQDNSFRESWVGFFADNRLRFILSRSERSNGKDAELRQMVETTADRVVPRLLADDHLNNGKGIHPVVVHGDLWSGNASRGVIGNGAHAEDVVYDPSSCYAHNEYELGIMKMFGGFGSKFLEEYHQICPKTEPVDEYEDRIALYELYHQLNHHALFGGGYRSGAVSIMHRLITKYSESS